MLVALICNASFVVVFHLECYFSFSLLDDLGNEIEMTDSKLQTMLIRVEKVLKLADGEFTFISSSDHAPGTNSTFTIPLWLPQSNQL